MKNQLLHRNHSDNNKNTNPDTRCVCQICTCGKHRCPPMHVQFNNQTTNQHYYKNHIVSPTKSTKCVYQIKESHYDPQVIKSTYRTNFKQHHIQSANLCKKYAYEPNKGHFYGQTQYNKNYIANQINAEEIAPNVAPCRNAYVPNSAKFQAKTTYRQQFRGKKTDPVENQKHYAYKKNDLPFYGKTTYGDTYKSYKIDGDRPQTACHQGYQKSNAKFEAVSSYKDDYKVHKLQREGRCLIEQLPTRPRECSPGKDHLHYCATKCNWE